MESVKYFAQYNLYKKIEMQEVSNGKAGALMTDMTGVVHDGCKVLAETDSVIIFRVQTFSEEEQCHSISLKIIKHRMLWVVIPMGRYRSIMAFN